MKRSDGVSMKTSMPSIMAYVANFSLKADGSVAFTCSADNVQSISMKDIIYKVYPCSEIVGYNKS